MAMLELNPESGGVHQLGGRMDDRRGFARVAPVFGEQDRVISFLEHSRMSSGSLLKTTELRHSFVLVRCITWNDKPGRASKDQEMSPL